MKNSTPPMSDKKKGFGSVLFDLFRSMKFTIFLLILLAILSIIGTVILQNATRDEYVHRYGTGLYEILNFFNLLDMYHAWWFVFILLLLVLNLIACSIHRLPGILNQVFRKPETEGLQDSMVRSLPFVERIKAAEAVSGEEEIRGELTKLFGAPKKDETAGVITLFSEKGRFSRLGVPLTHLSIIIILVGGMIGGIFGFKGFVTILEGETVDRVFLRAKEGEIPKALPFAVRCDDFSVSFYDLPGRQKHVKEYTSILTIIENGTDVRKETVKVNHPLFHKGLAFYQSSYGAMHDMTLGVLWKGQKEKVFFEASEGATVPIPNSPFSIRVLRYEHQVDNMGEGVQLALFKPNQPPQALWVLKDVPQFDEQRGDQFVLTIEKVIEREYTGLQVTKDPGVWVVWSGCGLMIFGLIVAFFLSHQRVWVRIPKDRSGGEIVVAGSASKNRIAFESKFRDLVERTRKKPGKAGKAGKEKG